MQLHRSLLLAAVAIPILAIADTAISLPAGQEGLPTFRLHDPERLRIALCQYETRTGNPDASFRQALAFMEEAADHDADFIVLPEYSFTSTLDVASGDVLNHPLAGQRLESLKRFLRNHPVYLLVNHPTKRPDGTLYNESSLFGPGGVLVTNYQKRCISSLDLAFGYSPGKRQVVCDLPFGRVGLLVCKDADFPEKFDAIRDLDLAVIQFAFVGTWLDAPGEFGPFIPLTRLARQFVPKLAQFARTARTQVLAVNKTGFEEVYGYFGSSCALSRNGDLIAAAGTGSDILYVDCPVSPEGRMVPGATFQSALRKDHRDAIFPLDHKNPTPAQQERPKRPND